MGNAMGGGRRKRTKVMKIDGETFKIATPTRASDVIKDHPDHVLLESEAVKHYGLRAKPLEPHHELKPRKLYFLLQLPELPGEKAPRRTRSGVHVTAIDRLECLMLSRRSTSDLQIVRPGSGVDSGGSPSCGKTTRPMQVKVRLPRAEVEKLVKESKDKTEVAEKIENLYVRDEVGGGERDGEEEQWKPGARRVKAREKRVSFVQMKNGSTP